MSERLEIDEEEFDDLVLEGETDERLENTRRMVVARVHYPKKIQS
jgi:hypothetical protein